MSPRCRRIRHSLPVAGFIARCHVARDLPLTDTGGGSAIHTTCTIPVDWYPELEYLSCERCQYMWTIERTRRNTDPMASDVVSPGPIPDSLAGESGDRTAEPPRRIQRKRIRGWRMPRNAVYVGRGTKWGPPWVRAHFWWATDPARASVEAYREYIVRRMLRDPGVLASLRGKHLACWCPLDQPCHAEVLLELANR